jgi:hypothetical protein
MRHAVGSHQRPERRLRGLGVGGQQGVGVLLSFVDRIVFLVSAAGSIALPAIHREGMEIVDLAGC